MTTSYTFDFDEKIIPTTLPRVARRYAHHELFRAFPWAVWNSSALEGYSFTLTEVETIINGYGVAGHPISHTDDVRGIAAGWKVALDAMDNGRPVDEDLAREINGAITRLTSLAPGEFRGESTEIHGDGGNVRTPRGDYTAPKPAEIREQWDSFDEPDPIRRAFLRIPFLARLQPFWDGNKRTALMLSAVDLVQSGYPPILVQKGQYEQWHEGLTSLFIDSDADGVLEVLADSPLRM